MGPCNTARRVHLESTERIEASLKATKALSMTRPRIVTGPTSELVTQLNKLENELIVEKSYNGNAII
jgi:hypothetical protein